jgi:hypothetical protein
MKKVINSIFFSLLVVTALTACTDAAPYRDVLYFTGTEENPASKFTIDGPANIGLTVTASTQVTSSHKIKVRLAPELLDAYNKANGKNYKLVPEGSYHLSSDETVIDKGENVSEPLVFQVLSTDSFEEGFTHCMPITITNVEGGMEVLETSRTVYVVLEKTIITHAADLRKSVYYTIPFANNTALAAVPQVSMEARIKMNGFQSSKPYISSVIGIEENFLLRFGDVNIDKSQLQLAGGGYQITSQTKFDTNKWYHVAVVYDGATITLYVDGAVDGSTAAPRGAINLTDSYSGGFHIGFSAGGRYLNGAVSEVRVWKKALTANEIKNNMCYVTPDNYADMVAYWRFNEGAGAETIKDWSGNGWDLKAGSPTWIDNVRCPE